MSTLPYSSALIERLNGIRRKVKGYAVTFGVALVITIGAGLLLLTVLLDWTLNLPTIPRVVLILAALAAFAYSANRWVLRPILSRLTLGDVAGKLEGAFPQFDDRLRSTVNFLNEPIPGSEPMKQRVVQQADEMAGRIDLGNAIVARPMWYSVGGAIGAVALLALLATLAGPTFLGIAGNRLLLGEAKWPKAVQIAMLGDVPHRVPVGKPVDVKMRLAKGEARVKKATIFYRFDPTGPWQKELMNRADDGTFAASLDTRLKSEQERGELQVRVVAGDDEVAINPITIVPRLDVARITADVLPPAYARGNDVKASSINLGERPAVMAVGSDVLLRIEFNKPLAKDQQVSIQPAKEGQKAPTAAWALDGDRAATGTFNAREPMRFVVRATDEDGFQNTGTEEYELIVREDGAPTVQIDEPRRSEDRTPNAAFPVKVTADDDYGIEQLQLVVKRLNQPKSADPNQPAPQDARAHEWVIDLVKDAAASDESVAWAIATDGNPDRRRFRMEYLWELEQLADAKLAPGDVLEYFVQVKDNFKLDGAEHEWVPSGKLRVTIITPEQAENAARAVAEQIHQQIGQIKRNVLTNKAETENLAQHTQEAGKYDPADQKQAERLAGEQSTAAQQTKQIAGKLADLLERLQQNKVGEKGLQQQADQAGKQLEQTAEGALKEASKQLSAAKDQKSNPGASAEQQKQNTEQRNQQLGEAQKQQDQAAAQLQQAMDKLGEFGGLEQAIAKLEEIKKKQDELTKRTQEKMTPNLGKKPEDLNANSKKEMDDLAKEQQKLGEQTEKAIADMQKKSDQMKKSDPAGAEAMKQAAQTGQQQGVPQEQQQAAQKMQQNQQGQAQNSQKKVELGLEMMLRKLKEAERRKLEELVKKLSDVQKLVNELVRRQAGHNIDNLTIDDVKKLTAMTEEERNELLDLSERDAAALPPPPTTPQLSASQEQTERNTRDVAKTAEALPDPAPATKLTQAAGQMERAIVSLRASNLPDAYDPPQVEALRALREAKAKVDEALAKAREQMQQQDAETIRQAYVKILEAQRKKVNAPTKEIDGAAAQGGGHAALPRETAVRLGQLPEEQAKLSETTAKLSEDLEKIGSIVYVWANKDIVKTMDEVKADLAKPKTDVPVQAEQTRIEEQLVAMIASLKENPKQGDFESKGGGACKNCKTMMPSEVELRLLKELQVAVNKSTKTIDAEAKKEAEKLLALGGRQGEIRNLLDQMVQKSSQGKVKLADEPDNKDQLPEEANDEDIENQEFVQGLIGGELTDDTVSNNVKLTGDRMARSRQRLALNNDPGQVTQKIQDRIIEDLDLMIELARRQLPKPSSKPGQGQGQAQKKPGAKPGEQAGQQQANQQGGKKPGTQTGGNQAAQDSSLNQGGNTDADPSADIREGAAEWGALTPRQREAVIEGKGEITIEKYRNLVQDYYRELAKKAREPQ